MLGRHSRLDAPDRELERFRFRVGLAGFAVFVAFALLAARLFHLQVVQHDYYSTRAEDNRISLVPIVPNRGVILDRQGTVLARNYSAFTLEITPSRVEDLEATIDGLSKVIEVLPKDRKRFRRLLEESKTFESLPIRTRLSEEEVARFAANRYLFPGVEVKARLFRHYPEGAVGAHAIGYISRINKRDLEIIEESEQTNNYKGTDHIGKSGLEQKYEFQLHGETGYEQVEIDAGRGDIPYEFLAGVTLGNGGLLSASVLVTPRSVLSYYGPDTLAVVEREARKLVTPYLIVHAEGDSATPVQWSDRLYATLLTAGTDVTYHQPPYASLYPNGGPRDPNRGLPAHSMDAEGARWDFAQYLADWMAGVIPGAGDPATGLDNGAIGRGCQRSRARAASTARGCPSMRASTPQARTR